MSLEPINPASLAPPRGYSHGMLAPAGGRPLYVAGQVAWDGEQRIGSDDFAAQFAQALDNVLAVVAAAGGSPQDLAQMTIFVADKEAYAAATPQLGAVWRQRCGRHYPAIALVEVAALLEPRALVEIQAIAVLPPQRG
ncbi:MAG: RidA family protein [Acidobacteria bacterium]|nr:MAG: RidA family protein [Acidobacteriota bacterium]